MNKQKKKMPKRLLSFLLVLTMVAGMLPVISRTVLAKGGSGTEEDPYIVTDYEELRLLMLDVPDKVTTYIKLGSDISYDADINEKELKLTSNYQSVVLDLNGYTLSRSGESTDHGIIYLYAGNLTIRDSSSAGTGKMTSDITGQKYSGTINVGSNGVLTIESGTFEVTNGTVPSVIHGKFGTAIIKGGTFINTVKYGYGIGFTDGKVIVDGGAFIIANEDPDPNCIGIYCSQYTKLCLYRCMVIGNITKFVYDLESVLPDECYAYNNTINNMPALIIGPKNDSRINRISTFVTEPVNGASPVYSVNTGSNTYTATVRKWYAGGTAAFPDTSSVMESSDTFLGGQTYIAEIEITPQNGYIIRAERSVTINGIPAYYSAGTDGTSNNAVVYRVAFTAEKVPLTGQVQFTSGAFPNQPIASELIGGNIIKAFAADSVHYQWQMKEGYFWKDLTDVYSNRKNYVPTTDQLGKEIRVVITGDGYEGSIASKSLLVTKKYCQASPNCPPGVSVLMIDGQYTGMRVETNAGQDYVWRENMESDVSSIDWSVNAFTKPNNKDYVDIRGLIEGNTIQIPLGGEVTIPLDPFPSEATSWSAFTIGDPTGLSPVYEVTNPTDKVQLTMPSSITLKGKKVGGRILQAYYNGGMYYYGTWNVHVYDPADPGTYQVRFTNRPAYPDITLNEGDSVMPIMPESGLMLPIEANDKFEYKWYVYSGCDSQGIPSGKAEENGYISIDPDTGKVTALSTEFDENQGSKYQPYAVLYFVNKSNSNQYGVVTKYKVNIVSGDIPVENVFIAPSIVNLTPGSTSMLSATVSPTNHTQNGYVVWSKKNGSDNITINPVTGEVTVSDAATNGEMATVRATFGDKYGECVINVSRFTEEEHIHTYAYSYTQANASAKTNGQRIKYCTNCYEISATLEINYPKAITLSSKSFVYNGKVQTPTVTVTDVNGKVIDKKHYDVSMPTDSKAMGKYNCKVTFKGNYYTGSLNASYVIVPKTTGIESLQNATDGIMIKWKANTQATGYKILRSEDGTNFAVIKTIKDKSIVSYLDTGANKNGKKYIYKIYAYNNAGGTTVTSAASTAKAIYRIDRPVISSITPVVGKIALEWKKLPNVSGYEIRYATDASFKENDNTIVIASETAYRKTITGLTSGKRYYFKIRAYKEVSGKKYYSAWSSAKSAVVK